jgi:hypothetical protein
LTYSPCPTKYLLVHTTTTKTSSLPIGLRSGAHSCRPSILKRKALP